MKKRFQPLYWVAHGVVKPFVKCKVISEIEEVPSKAIVLSNHSGKGGPCAIRASYPNKHIHWGAHEMLEGYKERYKYLRDVFYIQKCKKGKFFSSIRSAFEAIFSPYMYRGLRILPVYTDVRFATTIKESSKALDSNVSVVIYSEDSTDGYHEVLTKMHPGFILLSDFYYKKTHEDVPIIPIYPHCKKKKMAIGEPIYLQELRKQNLNNEQICDYLRDAINNLFYTKIKNA